MLKPDELRAIAADLEDVSLRVGEDDQFVLQTVAENLLAEAKQQEDRAEALRELTRISQEEGGYR